MWSYINKAFQDSTAWLIFFLFAIWHRFFNYQGFADLSHYDEVLQVVMTIMCISMASYMIKCRYNTVAMNVQMLLCLFLSSIFVASYFWGQTLYYGLRAIMGSFMLLSVFFILDKKRVSTETVVNAMLLIVIVHSLLQVVGAITFPNNAFGTLTEEAMEKSLIDLRDRGVLRLNIPGADFVILAIFWVIVTFRNNKRVYWWLLPLFAIVVMRGTRTPLLGVIVISFLYFIWDLKYRWVGLLVGVFLLFAFEPTLNYISNSNSDNTIVKYVQLTQLEADRQDAGNDNIRILMSEYYLHNFNEGNFAKDVIGNGVPGIRGRYREEVASLSEYYGFYVNDVGFVEMFVYFGYIGIFVYLLLFYKVASAHISKEYVFARLMIFYYFAILPTNSMLLSNPIPLAFTLYLLHKGQLEYIKD